jgi:hypothetical protein
MPAQGFHGLSTIELIALPASNSMRSALDGVVYCALDADEAPSQVNALNILVVPVGENRI